jgi:hypothetical protein
MQLGNLLAKPGQIEKIMFADSWQSGYRNCIAKS